MISVAFALILVPYVAVAAFFLVMALVHVQHLVHYGATTKASFLATFAFLAGATLILFTTWFLLQGTDWTQQFRLTVPGFGAQQASVPSPFFKEPL
jgi:hypothetical protein